VIDLHCHLDLYPDPKAVVAECVARRLYVLSVTTVPSAFEGTSALAPSEGRIRTAIGLHPELAAARTREMPLFERLLPRTRYVGEIGLDGSRGHRSTLDVQRGVLKDVLRLCASAGGNVLSVHSRGATGLILDPLSAEPGVGTPILHWYVGSPKQIARAVEMGCWFSIGPTMLASERGRTAVRAMPKERILPESDGPFGLIRGQAANPWDAWMVTPVLSEFWREPVSAVAARLVENFTAIVEEA
jgi:TatD DNase family protein